MKAKVVLSVCTALFAASLQANWFASTPLQAAYTALAQENPQLAWQELQIALSQHTMNQQHWIPVKEAILDGTECGRRLNAATELAGSISVYFISKSDSVSLDYQIKLSAESVTQAIAVTLIDPNGTSLLQAEFDAQQEYREVETQRLIIKPTQGLYQLLVNDQRYPLIISGLSDRQWLQLDDVTFQPKLTLDLPQTSSSCAPASAHWQWFNNQYDMLSQRQLVTATPQGTTLSAALPPDAPPQATRLSAIVSQYEYQSGVQIKYIQRAALPLPGSGFRHTQ